VSVVGKLLFQDTWCSRIDWNELLSSELGAPWHAWVATLVSFHRCMQSLGGYQLQGDTLQNHFFCDASERAYWSALYISSTKDDKTLVRLTCSKNRLAPLKTVTLSRLELLAALVGTRLLHYFYTVTSYDINQAILRSEATMALGWIRSDPNFVCNSHGNTNTHENHGMEALPGAGQPC